MDDPQVSLPMSALEHDREVVDTLRGQLAEADAVIARAFPRATPTNVQPDTWRAVYRHRCRVADFRQ